MLSIADGGFNAIGSLAGGGTVVIGPNDPSTVLFVGALGSSANTTFSGAITGAGSFELDGGSLTLTGAGSNIGGDLTVCTCANGALTISGGSFTVGGNTLVEGGTLAVTNGGQLVTSGLAVVTNLVVDGLGSSATVTGVTGIGQFGPATVTISNGGVLNSQGGAEIDSLFGTPAVMVTGPGSAWNVGMGLVIGGGSFGGTGILTVADGGVVNSTGFTTIGNGSTLNLGVGGLAGSIQTPAIVNDGQIVANFTDTSTIAADISGTGTLSKAGPGTLTLTGNNTYTGATTVNAGALIVNGSIADSDTTVNVGGTLGGTGIVGSTTINGGTLAPGNSIGTLTVQGNLVMTAAALYIVEVSSGNADRTNVTGTATLGGTVQAVFLPGSHVKRRHTILHADGGLGGTTFNGLTIVPPGFTGNLSYTSTDVLLDLTASLGTAGLNQNQQNVADALNSFFNNGGTLPPSFLPLFSLTGANLRHALTLLSGEVATGAQQGAFQLNNQFLGLMLDPFVDGRAGAGGAGGQAIGFAPEREEMPEDLALAYAKVTKTPVYKAPVYAPTFEQRWSVWGGGFGGTNKTSGDPLVVGSHDLTARTAGFAAGLDYRVAPGTVVGFALAGGGTNWGLANGLGTGKSDAFQAGLYGSTRWGALYVAAALAYAWHDVSTDRFALAGNHLTAEFDAQSVGGRVEAGYRVGSSIAAIIPYAAVQAQNFRTPSYVESDLNAGGFGLAYNSRNGTATRSELGARADRLFALNPNAVLALRGRLAWAHDWVSDPTLAAGFQTLPGSSFIVNGATPAKDLALVSAGAELRLANGVTLSGKFDGEFAEHSTTYAGTGTIRYTW